MREGPQSPDVTSNVTRFDKCKQFRTWGLFPQAAKSCYLGHAAATCCTDCIDQNPEKSVHAKAERAVLQLLQTARSSCHV